MSELQLRRPACTKCYLLVLLILMASPSTSVEALYLFRLLGSILPSAAPSQTKAFHSKNVLSTRFTSNNPRTALNNTKSESKLFPGVKSRMGRIMLSLILPITVVIYITFWELPIWFAYAFVPWLNDALIGTWKSPRLLLLSVIKIQKVSVAAADTVRTVLISLHEAAQSTYNKVLHPMSIAFFRISVDVLRSIKRWMVVYPLQKIHTGVLMVHRMLSNAARSINNNLLKPLARIWKQSYLWIWKIVIPRVVDFVSRSYFRLRQASRVIMQTISDFLFTPAARALIRSTQWLNDHIVVVVMNTSDRILEHLVVARHVFVVEILEPTARATAKYAMAFEDLIVYTFDGFVDLLVDSIDALIDSAELFQLKILTPIAKVTTEYSKWAWRRLIVPAAAHIHGAGRALGTAAVRAARALHASLVIPAARCAAQASAQAARLATNAGSAVHVAAIAAHRHVLVPATTAALRALNTTGQLVAQNLLLPAARAALHAESAVRLTVLLPLARATERCASWLWDLCFGPSTGWVGRIYRAGREAVLQVLQVIGRVVMLPVRTVLAPAARSIARAAIRVWRTTWEAVSAGMRGLTSTAAYIHRRAIVPAAQSAVWVLHRAVVPAVKAALDAGVAAVDTAATASRAVRSAAASGAVASMRFVQNALAHTGAVMQAMLIMLGELLAAARKAVGILSATSAAATRGFRRATIQVCVA